MDGEEDVYNDVQQHAQEVTAEQQLLERFRLHKENQHAKEDFLKKTRKEAIQGAARRSGESNKPKPKVVDMARVDHNNRPHRWKDASVLTIELEKKKYQKMLRDAEPVRTFPGSIRKRLASDQDEEVNQATMTQNEEEDELKAAKLKER
jgi:hypothetical protein